ncbi:PAS domain S-box protein [Flavisolibacter tropicus]|uniref:histidine kinase n=1 Tax=Flavisolibacter tropicus TaxID=1492898 RepID=A0A172TVH1_9BACT|nr:PAS domain S-box protein [Flavisolibacter tropicus]ANE50737.1 hypothetical protein SY85_09745 [Flavisolibacter tropicus]
MKDLSTTPLLMGETHHGHNDDLSFYHNLLNASQSVICSLDAKGKFLFTNSAAYNLWGYTPAELMGWSIRDLVIGQDRRNFLNALAHAKLGIEIIRIETQCTCKNGLNKLISWTIQWDATKQVLYCVASEATPTKLEKETFKQQVGRLDRAYKLVNLVWWEYDVATQTFTTSSELFNLLGLTIPEDHKITAAALFSFIHPEDINKLTAVLTTLDQDTYPNYQHRIIKNSGELIDVAHYAEVIRDDKGKAIRVEGAGQDITKQKLAEALIKQSEEKYKLVFNQSLIPKLMFNIDSLRIVEVNDAAIKQYGYNREEFLALTIIDLRPSEDRQDLYETIERYRHKRHAVFSSMHRHMRKDGSLFFVQIEATIIELTSGLHSLVIANDMTEKLQMQHRIINEKVTAQKEIAKAIIQTQEQERKEIGKELHDNVNQILTTVKLYIENIKSFPEHQAAFIEKSVVLTQKAIDEIRLLSKQLVSPVINDLNFKAAITELIEHYRWLNLFEIQFTFHVEEEYLSKDMQLTLYRIVQEQMNNIVKHAKASLVAITIAANKETIAVSVIDNGVGFDITTTTDGVGINNIKNRTEVYKGIINLITAPGKGCSLIITFPNS